MQFSSNKLQLEKFFNSFTDESVIKNSAALLRVLMLRRIMEEQRMVRELNEESFDGKLLKIRAKNSKAFIFLSFHKVSTET